MAYRHCQSFGQCQGLALIAGSMVGDGPAFAWRRHPAHALAAIVTEAILMGSIVVGFCTVRFAPFTSV
jgi:hypothetical protein